MDIKELMIGDWVNVATTNQPRKIEGTNDLLFHDDYDAIPLTESILVKNGFKKAYTKVHGLMVDENLWFGHIGVDYVELRLEGNVAVWKDYDEKADGLYSDYLFPLPTSVHQLQHMLRLCGIDKEIEL